MEEVNNVHISSIDDSAMRKLAQNDVLKSISKVASRTEKRQKTHEKKIEKLLDTLVKASDPRRRKDKKSLIKLFDDLEKVLPQVNSGLDDLGGLSKEAADYEKQINDAGKALASGTKSSSKEFVGALNDGAGSIMRTLKGFSNQMFGLSVLSGTASVAYLLNEFNNLAAITSQASFSVLSFTSGMDNLNSITTSNMFDALSNQMSSLGMSTAEVTRLYNENGSAISYYQRATGTAFSDTIDNLRNMGDAVYYSRAEISTFAAEYMSRQRMLGNLQRMNEQQMQARIGDTVSMMQKYANALGVGVEDISKMLNNTAMDIDYQSIASSLSSGARMQVDTLMASLADVPAAADMLRKQFVDVATSGQLSTDFLQGLNVGGVGDLAMPLQAAMQDMKNGVGGSAERVRELFRMIGERIDGEQIQLAIRRGGLNIDASIAALAGQVRQLGGPISEAQKQQMITTRIYQDMFARISNIQNEIVNSLASVFFGLDNLGSLVDDNGNITADGETKIQTMMAGIDGFIDGFVGVIKTVMGGIKSLMGMFGAVAPNLDGMNPEEKQKAMKEYGQEIGSMLGKMVGVFGAIVLFNPILSPLLSVIKFTAKAGWFVLSKSLPSLFKFMGKSFTQLKVLGGKLLDVIKTQYKMGGTMLRGIGRVISRVFAIPAMIITGLFGAYEGWMEDTTASYGERALNALKGAFVGIGDFILGIPNMVLGWFGLDTIQEYAGRLGGMAFDLDQYLGVDSWGDAIGLVLSTVGDIIMFFPNSLMNGVTKIGSIVGDLANNALDGIISAIKGVLSSIIKSIKTFVGNIGDGVSDVAGSMFESIKGWFSGSDTQPGANANNANRRTRKSSADLQDAARDANRANKDAWEQGQQRYEDAEFKDITRQLLEAQRNNIKYLQQIAGNTRTPVDA